MRMYEKAIVLLEDKYMSLFKYVNFNYEVDIVQGISMPLPD